MHKILPLVLISTDALYNRTTAKKSNRINKMNNTEFHELVDEKLQLLEDMIDDSGADIEPVITGNVLTLEFENRSQIVINKQEPMHEIWLASKSGGFHFSYVDEKWTCSKTGMEFIEMVKEECQKHADEEIEWV